MINNRVVSGLKANLDLGWEDCQHAVIGIVIVMSFCAWWQVVLWEQMYVIGCSTKSQHGSRSTRFLFKNKMTVSGLNAWCLLMTSGQTCILGQNINWEDIQIDGDANCM